MSATELRDLAKLAARGAGAHAGQADHFGRATVVHLQSGHGPDLLQNALDALPGGPIQTLPFAELPDDPDALGRSYRALRTQNPATQNPATRVDVPDTFLGQMTALAAKTFVPASDASRLSGAGAGVADND